MHFEKKNNNTFTSSDAIRCTQREVIISQGRVANV